MVLKFETSSEPSKEIRRGADISSAYFVCNLEKALKTKLSNPKRGSRECFNAPFLQVFT